jgi:hypothetical protein
MSKEMEFKWSTITFFKHLPKTNTESDLIDQNMIQDQVLFYFIFLYHLPSFAILTGRERKDEPG